MRKLIIAICLCMLFASCGKSETTKGTIKPTSLEGVWYIGSDNGGETVVRGVYLFKDGGVTAYDITQWRGNGKADLTLGTLEEYYKLSDEEAMELAKKHYEEAYSEYISVPAKEKAEWEENGIPTEDEWVIEDIDRAYSDTEMWDSLVETVSGLEGAAPTEHTSHEYKIRIQADESGNNVEYEVLLMPVSKEITWDGYRHEDAIYTVNTDDSFESVLGLSEVVAPKELYDTYYGGYKMEFKDDNSDLGWVESHFLTICDEDTAFEFDEPGAEGVETL